MSQPCDNYECDINDGEGLCSPEGPNVMLDEYTPPLCNLYIDPNEDVSQRGVEQRHAHRLEQARAAH